jgi:3D (Asp-Asp-Asp) domain-containing protein
VARFVATAYCKGQTTASGVAVRAGIAAADPKVLPLGSIIRLGGEAVDAKYHGVYSVLDTGPLIKGRRLDLYIWSCYEALDFGRRGVEVTVLRHGWDDKRASD